MASIFLTSKFSEVSKKIFEILDKKNLGKDVLFITTASKFSKDKSSIKEDFDKFKERGFNIYLTDISNKSEIELINLGRKYRIIFIAGGNTFFLMQEIKKIGFDKVLFEIFKNNKAYIGSSAGSAIFGLTIKYLKIFDDYSLAKNINNYSGLKFFNFLLYPHYNQEKFIRFYPLIKKKYKKSKFVKIRDDQFIYFEGDLSRFKIF